MRRRRAGRPSDGEFDDGDFDDDLEVDGLGEDGEYDDGFDDDPLDPADELVIARLAPHGRALVGPIVAILIVAAASVYLWGVLPERWMSDVAAALGALVVLVGAVPPIVRWAATRYVVTDQRLIVSRGVVTRRRHELLLARAGEVTLRRRGSQALVGSGDVLIAGPGEHPLVFADVPRPRLVQRAILELLAERSR